jgi:hypothetical protein
MHTERGLEYQLRDRFLEVLVFRRRIGGRMGNRKDGMVLEAKWAIEVVFDKVVLAIDRYAVAST